MNDSDNTAEPIQLPEAVNGFLIIPESDLYRPSICRLDEIVGVQKGLATWEDDDDEDDEQVIVTELCLRSQQSLWAVGPESFYDVIVRLLLEATNQQPNHTRYYR